MLLTHSDLLCVGLYFNMLCPYCLIETQASTFACEQCKQVFPPAYVQAQNAKSARPPVIISIVGFSGHGKTVYLASLFHTLERLVPRYWPEFSPLALDQDTLTSMEERHQLLQKGKLPESTRLNFPKPSIHRLSGIPQYGDRTLLLYDPPGEAFNRDEGIGQYAGFVKRSNCVLFLISLPNLDKPVADGMFKLLNTYILGMSALSVPEQVQHLIVAYTKADEIIGQMASPELQQYLRQQGVEKLGNLKEYYRGMEGISKSLEQFTADTLEAHRFLNQARRHFKSVTFTAVSSLGSQPRNGELEEQIAPRRVLDPLLWVLSKPTTILTNPVQPLAAQPSGGGGAISKSSPDVPAPLSAQSQSGFTGKVIGLITGILLFMFIVIWLASRSSKPDQTMSRSVTTGVQTSKFIGAINNRYHIEMSLQQNGNTLSGSLLTSFGKTQRISGTVDGQGNVVISEYDGSGVVRGVFRGRLSSSLLSGTWTMPNGSQPASFTMRKE
jgi:hypothetical protein